MSRWVRSRSGRDYFIESPIHRPQRFVRLYLMRHVDEPTRLLWIVGFWGWLWLARRHGCNPMIMAPDHMDRWSRMERLYRHLLGLGLVVSPAFADAERGRISHLYVSVDLPPEATPESGAENAASGLISMPVSRAEIADVVGAPESQGVNVVPLPSGTQSAIHSPSIG